MVWCVFQGLNKNMFKYSIILWFENSSDLVLASSMGFFQTKNKCI